MAISLASIHANTPKPPRIIIHSEPGVGKTTLAANAPAPIFIQTEDGLGDLAVKAFPQSRSFTDVMEALASLYMEEHPYKTVVVDSLDWLEPLIWDHVCQFWTDGKGKAERLSSIEDAGYGKGYVEALGYWRQFFSAITSLRDDRGMIIIMTAHTEIKRIEDPSLPAYDKKSLKLHKKAAALAEEYSDMILFASKKVNTISEDSGFNKKRVRATSTGERVMQTTGEPSFTAKNRYNLPAVLPLEWSALASALGLDGEKSAA